jgi:hypothetical protein
MADAEDRAAKRTEALIATSQYEDNRKTLGRHPVFRTDYLCGYAFIWAAFNCVALAHVFGEHAARLSLVAACLSCGFVLLLILPWVAALGRLPDWLKINSKRDWLITPVLGAILSVLTWGAAFVIR